MDKKVFVTVAFIILPFCLYANAGAIVIPQGVPFFWISTAIIILLEFFLSLILSPSISKWKTFTFVLIGNVLSTLAGLPLIIVYLKIWEKLFQYTTSIIPSIILFLIIFMIPSIAIEYFFYQKVFSDNTAVIRIGKTIALNVISYVCLIILLVAFNKVF